MTLVERTSAKSWSSEATQKTGTTGRPRRRLELTGDLERRERLQQHEQGAAEEARLLAGDDRDGGRVAEAAGLVRGRRRLPRLLLAHERPGHARARALEAQCRLGGAPDRVERETVATEERRHRVAARKVVEKERTQGLAERRVGKGLADASGHRDPRIS